MEKRYVIDFYDMIDGWIHSWELSPEYCFDGKEAAITKCKELQSALNYANIHASEHYGVIDLQLSREVFCGKRWDPRLKE